MTEEIKVEEKPKREINKWKIFSLVLIVILCLSFLVFGTGITGMTISDNIVNSEEAANKAIDYINENLVSTGELTLVSTNEVSGIYNVTFSYQGREGSFYLTKDGKYMIILGLGIFDLTKEFPKPAEEEQPESTIGNFLMSNDPVCEENGKPIIYFFGSEGCPHCRWEHPIIGNVTADFEGYISFHNNMDNDQDRDVFSKYSTGGIPTIVLGCKYYRVGSGESLGEEQETKVLTAIICKLTNNQPQNVCSGVQDLIAQIV